MIAIDWGDLHPTSGQRARVDAQLRAASDVVGPVVSLRRRGQGYEAQLLTPFDAELRLTGDDLSGVVERAVGLLSVVSRA
jgi:hypothetical protein